MKHLSVTRVLSREAACTTARQAAPATAMPEPQKKSSSSGAPVGGHPLELETSPAPHHPALRLSPPHPLLSVHDTKPMFRNGISIGRRQLVLSTTRPAVQHELPFVCHTCKVRGLA